MAARPTIAVDLDGVVHEYSQGWNGGQLGEPMPGARDALIRLSRTFRLVLFTARHDLDAVTRWLNEHRLLYLFDDVTNRKPVAKYYLDDRAVKFVTWEQALNDLT